MRKIEEWYDLRGRTAILTGATGFIGPSYARTLSECGANVVVTDLDQIRCERLAADLRDAFKTKPLALPLDLTQKEEVDRAADRIAAQYGRIDILINNAAYHQLEHLAGGNESTLEDFPLATWQRTIDVNLTGTLLACQAVGKIMLRQGGGSILNVSSVYGVVAADQRIYGDSGLNSNVAYAVTKAGLLNFTRYLAAYWQGRNIRVNSLSPGGVHRAQDEQFVRNYTNRTMLGRMADVDDLTAAMLYLVSDASKFVTGFNMVVDGGWTAW